MYGKLSEAVTVLVTNHHDVRERVWVAAKYLSAAQAAGVPESCREDIEWIHKMLTRYPAECKGESALDATYRRTGKRTAAKIAERIWKLYRPMQSEIETRQRGECIIALPRMADTHR
jgi:hypothetical protein